MPALTEIELADLLKGPFVAKLGTITVDGWPCVTPVWFEYKEGSFYIIARKHSEFVRHIRSNPRVHVLVDEPQPLYSRVHSVGNAEIIEGPSKTGKWVELARSMARRYLGQSMGGEYFDQTSSEPRYLLRISPLRMQTWRGTNYSAGERGPTWHSRYFEK